MENKVQYRIGAWAIFILVAFALVCDLIGIIPIAKDITGPLFWIIADIYLWKKGVSFFGGKEMAAELISLITSLIPFIQELPIELTVGIAAIIIMTRIEDRTGLNAAPLKGLAGLSSGANIMGTRLPHASKPLNQGESRAPNGRH